MPLLFSNTGIQLLCIPLPAGRRYRPEQIGRGWNNCRCQSLKSETGRQTAQDAEAGDENDNARIVPYVQWQIVQSNVSKLFLAVDTTLGDPDLGYFCDPGALAGDRTVRIGGL